jgi:hypothetical protein
VFLQGLHEISDYFNLKEMYFYMIICSDVGCMHNVRLGVVFEDDGVHYRTVGIYLNEIVNKQNSQLWGAENPNLHEGAPLQPAKCTVWCSAVRIVS